MKSGRKPKPQPSATVLIKEIKRDFLFLDAESGQSVIV
jgi:hypothetical protein